MRHWDFNGLEPPHGEKNKGSGGKKDKSHQMGIDREEDQDLRGEVNTDKGEKLRLKRRKTKRRADSMDNEGRVVVRLARNTKLNRQEYQGRGNNHK